MKKFINKVDDVVVEQMQGMAAAHADIKICLEPKYMFRADSPNSKKVALVSGGGSGHEPMHGGFVGLGMLDGACPGEMFTSPTPDQMLECATKVNGGPGVLFIVKNYTGDVMNFDMATEMLHEEGIPVQSILVDDDVAVKDSLYTAGRRGVGTTVLLEKIVGGAAEAGYNLDECADLARKVNTNGRSMGIALTSCTVPAAGKPNFEISDEEIEFGVGIHGEPGRKRIAHTTADEITSMMANGILEDEAYTRVVREWDRLKGEWEEKEITSEPLKEGDEVIVMVNSLGGTPLSELYVVYRKLAEICEAKGIKIVEKLVGSYITSLEMQGCTITMLKADSEIKKFWNAPVNTPGMRWGV